MCRRYFHSIIWPIWVMLLRHSVMPTAILPLRIPTDIDREVGSAEGKPPATTKSKSDMPSLITPRLHKQFSDPYPIRREAN